MVSSKLTICSAILRAKSVDFNDNFKKLPFLPLSQAKPAVFLANLDKRAVLKNDR